MQFGHEQLDVYRLSIRYVAWAYQAVKRLNGVDRHARDQLLRASQSIPLNIAEGNGRGTNPDRRRFFEIARGSALECAAIQDCLEACEVLAADENADGKTILTRIVSMLTRLGRREDEVRESSVGYDCSGGAGGFDYDYDYDYDNDYDNDNDNDSDSDSDKRGNEP
jgi:four helix bundle protein